MCLLRRGNFKSARNQNNLRNFAKFDPGLIFMLGRSAACKIIYVRQVAGPENTRNEGENPKPPEVLILKLFMASFWVSSMCKILSGPVRDTSPYRAIPFRDSIAEGGIAAICLVFMWYRICNAGIPLLWGGGSHLHFACSSREKGEGVSHRIGHVETPITP